MSSIGEVNEKRPILAIDGTHVPIRAPFDRPFRCYNRKGFFSIVYLCVVDYKKRFRGVTYNNGSVHDARIYRTSALRELIEQLIDTPYCVVGDPAFCGFNGIEIPDRMNSQSIYTQELGKSRIIVENAFGLLKNKFRILTRRIDNGIVPNRIKMVLGIMWLHNYIIDKNKD